MYKKNSNEELSVEELFFNLAVIRGFKVEIATGFEQFDHIDFHLTSNEDDGKMTAMIDLKRLNEKSQKDTVEIEFKNVQGKEGWIYGISDFIAFETKKAFILSYRKELCDFCLNNVDLNNRSNVIDELEYVAFNDKGKQNLLSNVLIEDIIKLPHTQVWKK